MDQELGPKTVIAAVVAVTLVAVSMMVLYDSKTPSGRAFRAALRRIGYGLTDLAVGFIPALGMGLAWMVAAPFRRVHYTGRHSL